MQKKIPMRMCIGCREMKPKRTLVRIVYNKAGDIFLDPSGKAAGRGAYVCASRECFERIRKTRALERTFSCKIDEALYERLLEMLKNAETGSDARG